MIMIVVMLFFFKQKTAYEMRISDWSSDVCSSDLRDVDFAEGFLGEAFARGDPRGRRTPGIAGARDLARHVVDPVFAAVDAQRDRDRSGGQVEQLARHRAFDRLLRIDGFAFLPLEQEDRKSTRLNSSP